MAIKQACGLKATRVSSNCHSLARSCHRGFDGQCERSHYFRATALHLSCIESTNSPRKRGSTLLPSAVIASQSTNLFHGQHGKRLPFLETDPHLFRTASTNFRTCGPLSKRPPTSLVAKVKAAPVLLLQLFNRPMPPRHRLLLFPYGTRTSSLQTRTEAATRRSTRGPEASWRGSATRRVRGRWTFTCLP